MSDQPAEDLGTLAALLALAVVLVVLVTVVVGAFLLKGPHPDHALFLAVEPPASSVRPDPSL
jgi:hypothetical protein